MITLQNINKYYYTDTSVTQALRKINLEFHIGEFVAITGESGSGKSTLLNIISGMDTFDDGELYFDGEPTFQFDAADWEEFRRDRIGFVFQDYKLIGSYSVLENVVSALLIMGVPEEEAKKKAAHYLGRVGLEGMEDKRTSELSSGQKQRLSIARALAKETTIIVADEPTGNLDSETGKQIIELLKEVSENKLVLMVTHNYSQAEPYVTRKVQMHDGEVIADIPVNAADAPEKVAADVAGNDTADAPENATADVAEKVATDVKKEKDAKKQKDATAEKRYQNKIARIFAGMNTRTQRGKAALFRIFFLFTAVMSFVLIGQLYKNADDTSTKDYRDSIYYQKNDSRLSVRRKDGKALTKKDIQKMQSVRNVVQVDQYDCANDINYYIEEGKDYTLTTGSPADTEMYFEMDMGEEMEGAKSSLHSEKTFEAKNKNKFMRSITCIDKTDLAKGRMPESIYEIVLYADDDSVLGKEKEIYFTAENIMGSYADYHHKFKVVGLLKKETTQVYFHGDMCHMLSTPAEGDDVRLDYFYVEIPYKQYMGCDRFYVVIGDGLEGNEARASRNYLVPMMSGDLEGMTVENALPGENQFTFLLNTQRKGYPDELEKLSKVPVKLDVSGDEFNDQAGMYLEVSKEFYEKYFSRKSTQASVYIKNYTKTDRVIRKLQKLGYTAVSTYRISSVEYNPEKVMDRLVFIGIAIGILLALIIVEILILRSLMKIKIKDYYVLQSMGMKFTMMKKVSFYEMARYCIEVMLITVVIMLLLNTTGIAMLNQMMIYYGICAYATFFLYNFGLACVTVWSFNRLLKGRMAA